MILRLAARILRRNAGRLLITGLSLAVGAFALAAVLGIVQSAERFLRAESNVLIGGDVSISSATRVDADKDPVILEALAAGMQLAHTTEMLVMTRNLNAALVRANGTNPTALASAKIADSAYPLYGALLLEQAQPLLPSAGGIFASQLLARRLGAAIGDAIMVGDGSFIVENIIVREPDELGSGFRLGPPLLATEAGWQRTGILRENSRITNTLLLRFPAGLSRSAEARLTGRIEEHFLEDGKRVAVATRGPENLLRATQAGQRFFFTVIVLALFLAAVNIRVNLAYLLAALTRTAAIMRALGMARRGLAVIFAVIIAAVALAGGALGALLGNLGAAAALPYVSRLLERTLEPDVLTANIPAVTLFSLALALMAGLGFLVRISRTEPKILLGGYSQSAAASTAKHELPFLVLSLVAIGGGVWQLTGSATVAATAVAVILGSFAGIALLTHALVKLLHKHRAGYRFQTRAIIAFVHHQGPVFTSAVASLAIAVGAVSTIILLEANVLGNLRGQFQADAPNLYLLDVQPDQEQGVAEIVGDSWRVFPVVRGRFSERDGVKIEEQGAQRDRELSREFNLTYRAELIEGETVTAGTWHGTTGRGEISVERDFAERANIVLGSSLTFLVQGFPVTAKVTSMRSVQSSGGLPFFFLVYSPDVLADIPRSAFGYGFLPPAEINGTISKLVERYPNVSALPTADIIELVARVVTLLGAAVAAAAVPAFVLGLLMIVSLLAAAVRERTNDMLVFTAVGAPRPLLFGLFVRESLTGLTFAAVLGVVISHVTVLVLNRELFEFTQYFFSPLVIGAVAFLFIAATVVAVMAARRLSQVSPAALLRKH
jgi:putative ABC transport system permease protein